jgi:hypothetical protein
MLRWMMATTMIAMIACGSSASVQVVAWAGMLATRTVEQGWSTAVKTTFDGKHPCNMCHAAASLKQAETDGLPQRPVKGDQSPIGKSLKKIDTPVARLDTLDGPPASVGLIATASPWVMGEQFSPAPEPPPPRS